jgi:hypothetical protein
MTEEREPPAHDVAPPETEGRPSATRMKESQYVGWLKQGLPSSECPLAMAAWSYRSKRLSIFPVVADGKAPASSHGFQDATDDKQQITDWWGASPDNNIGLSCGPDNDIGVVDVDAKNGGLENWEALQKQHGALDSPLMVATPSGGLHIYFRLGDTPLVKSEGRIAAGIDVRGPTRAGKDGSYVLVPPSVVNGKRYTWQAERWVHPSQLPLAPRWLLFLAAFTARQRAEIASSNELQTSIDAAPPAEWWKTFEDHQAGQRDAKHATRCSSEAEPGAYSSYIEGAIASECQMVASAEIGQQEATLNSAAYKMGTLLAGAGHLDIDDEAVLEAIEELVDAGLQMENAPGRDPWAEREIRRKVQRGIEQGLANPREVMPTPNEQGPSAAEILQAMAARREARTTAGSPAADEGSTSQGPQALHVDSVDGPVLPLDAFPGPMKEAIEALAERHEAHPTLCAQSVLAAANLAVHARVNVRRLDNSVCPTSVFLVTLAESGERKSSVDATLMRPLTALEEHDQRTYDNDRFDHDVEKAVYEKLQETAKKEKDASKMREILQTLRDQPEPPLWRTRKTADFTIEGLGKVLQYGMGHIAIFSSEGGSLIGGHAFSEEAKLRTATALVQLWDGQAMTRIRVGEQVRLAHRRTTMSLMVQPRIADRFLMDEVLLEQGFINRLLVAHPPSLAGFREYPESSPFLARPIIEFQRRLTAHLELAPAIREGTRNELNPSLVDLAPAARGRIREFQRAMEPRLRQHSEFAHIRGYANRLSEQAVRLAATLQAFMEPDTREVTEVYAGHAIKLAEYFGHEMARLQNMAAAARGLRHARETLSFLLGRRASGDGSTFKVRLLCQKGPRPRDEASVRATLEVLAAYGHVYALDAEGRKIEGLPANHNGLWKLHDGSTEDHCRAA